MKIKADKKLFDAWLALANHVKALGSIVQNDMDIAPVDYAEWQSMLVSVQDKFKSLTTLTISHCGGEKKEVNDYQKEPEQKLGSESYLFDSD